MLLNTHTHFLSPLLFPQVLFDVVMLEVALRNGADPVTLANLMPKHWADFIRNSDITEVKPIGTTPLSGGRRP